jgi:LytS/YehU family sensor histidine kinase
MVENPRVLDNTPDQTGYSDGIGLKNVRRRLNIIYSDRHKLDIMENEDTFTVDLQLELDSEK